MIQKILHWFGEHLGSLVLALVLALAVWISAVVAADPNEARTMRPISLQVIGQPSSLVIANDIPEQVRLTLRAPKSIWTRLAEHPELVNSWIDLTGLAPGKHVLEVKAQIGISPIRFIKADPDYVEVQLETLVRQEMPVELVISGELPLGYKRDNPLLNPATVTISGPESAVTQVAKVRVQLNISGLTETVSRMEHLEILDVNDKLITGLSVSSKEIQVIQPISLLGRFRNVAVKVVTEGQVANGYRLTNISVSPPTFTIFSENPDLINETPGFVETMPVDLDGLTEDAAISVDLNLPEGLTTVRDPNVIVQISLAAIEGSMTLSIPVDVDNLPPELEATISPDTVDVIIAGPLFLLEQVTPDDFRALIDAGGLPPGIYQREVIVDVAPDHIRIQTTLPETVEVIIIVTPTASVTLETLQATGQPVGARTPALPPATVTPKP